MKEEKEMNTSGEVGQEPSGQAIESPRPAQSRFAVQEISDVLLAFPASVSHLMPKQSEIPDEFKDGYTRWNRIFSQWFFSGITNAAFIPKEGIDPKKALRHIRAIMGSFEPKHEHKESAVAFLLSEWFEDVTGDNLPAR